MDLAALPPGRSFSSARSRQRTLTHSPADTHLVASPKPAAPSSQLGSAGRALPSGPALGQQGRGAREGAVRWPPQGSPYSPRRRLQWGARSFLTLRATFFRLLALRWGGGGGAGSLGQPLGRLLGPEGAQVPGRRAGARSPPAGGPGEPGPAQTPPRSPLPLLIGQRSPEAPAGPGPVSQL